MATIVTFNGVQYSLDALRARAGSAPDIAIKRDDAVLDESLVDETSNTQLAQAVTYIETKLQPELVAARVLIVCHFEGKYYFLQGRDKAIERFKESDTVKARLLSKVALKKAVLGYQGAKIVVEEPESRYPAKKTWSTSSHSRYAAK
jgi:hypothetical protein